MTDRRLTSAAALGVVGLLAAGCAGESAEADGGSPFAGETIQATIQYDWAPLAYEDESGERAGLYVDLIEAAAEELDATVEWNETTFAQVIPGVQSGKYDIGVGTDPTVERQQVVDMVSIQLSGYAFLTRTEGGLDVGDDLAELCGATVAAMAGQSTIPVLEAHSAECEASGGAPVEIATFPDQASAQLAVQSGRADVATAYVAFAQHALSVEPDLSATGPLVSEGLSGLSFSQDSGDAEAFAEAVNVLIENGRYDEIFAEHELTDIAVEEALVNPAE